MPGTCSKKNVLVGVVDSGWDCTLAEPRVHSGIGLIEDARQIPSVRLTPDSHDRLGHGTGCADVILQVSPVARVTPIRVFGSRLETSPDVLVAAIDWAIAAGVRIINMSLGTDRADALSAIYHACLRAQREGVILVAAAGRHEGETYPAIFEPVIGVAADSSLHRFEISFAPGMALECAASGRHVARGIGGVAKAFVGSSFAAPVVTGHIANFISGSPSADVATVRQMLHQMAQNPTPRKVRSQ